MRAPGPQRSRGVTLVVVLMALIGLALASVALVRGVDQGGRIAGNLAFRQAATAAADPVAEAALAWLLGTAAGSTSALNEDRPAEGYYATSLDALDPTGDRPGALARVDWDGDGCGGAAVTCVQPRSAGTVDGQASSYLITRLCRSTGEPQPTASQTCATALGNLSAEVCRGQINYETVGSAGGGGLVRGCGLAPLSPYYRIIVRTVGGRGAVSLVETIVSLS